MANMRKRLTHVQAKGAQKSDNEEIMKSYAIQSEKTIESGKQEHLPKILLMKLDEQIRERQDKALAKASSPPKAAETAVPTRTVTRTSTSTSTMAVAIAQEKGKESEQGKQ